MHDLLPDDHGVLDDFRAAVSRVCGHVRQEMQAELAGVLLYNGKTNRLEMQSPTLGFPEEALSDCQVELRENCPSVHVFLSGEPALVADAASDPWVLSRYKQMFGLRSFVMVPIQVQQRCLGVLHVANKIQGTFGHKDVDRAREWTNWLATPLENGLLRRELAAVREVKSALVQTAAKLAGELDRRRVAATVAEGARSLIGARGAAVLQVTPSGGFRVYGQVSNGPSYDVLSSLAWRAIRDRRPASNRGGIAIPMLAGSELEGVLVLWPGLAGDEVAAAGSSLAELATVAAMALRNTVLFDAERQSATGARLALQNSQSEGTALRRLLSAQQRLGENLAGSAEPGAVCGGLASLLNRPVALYDDTRRIILVRVPADEAAFGGNGCTPFPHRLSPEVLEQGSAEGLLAWPIRCGATQLGSLALSGDEKNLSPADRQICEHAVQLCVPELQHRQALVAFRLQAQSDLLAELLAAPGPSAFSLVQRYQQVGCNLTSLHRLLVIRDSFADGEDEAATSGPGAGAAMAPQVLAWLDARERGGLVATYNRRVVVLLPVPDGTDWGRTAGLAAAQEIVADVQSHCGAVRVGVGGVCRDLADYPRSFQEADRIARVLPGSNDAVACAEDFPAAPFLLWQASDSQPLRQHAERTLAPLLLYDRAHGTELLKTLEAYLANESQLVSASAELYVHPNTLRYRLQKIQRLGINLEDSQSRFSLRLALQIHRWLGDSSVH